jgi:hypothetical protein
MVDPKTKIWDLCTDRAEQKKFKNLKGYFGDMNVEDLNELDDPEDLIRDVLPAHRLLMRVFIRKYLIPLRERPIDFASTEVTHIGNEDGEKVFAAGALVASDFASADQNRMTISRFHSRLVEGGAVKINFRYIDMSRNNLLSTDMKHVSSLVQDLHQRQLNASSGLILDLSNNRIHGIDQCEKEVIEAITSITACPSVEFVDLRANPFVSLDQKGFFASLTPASPEAIKLIWVQELHLPTHGWRLLVSEEVVETVLTNHAKYFAWRKSNSLSQ